MLEGRHTDMHSTDLLGPNHVGPRESVARGAIHALREVGGSSVGRDWLRPPHFGQMTPCGPLGCLETSTPQVRQIC